MKNRPECKDCDHLPVCRYKIRHNHKGMCPYYSITGESEERLDPCPNCLQTTIKDDDEGFL